MGMDYWERGGAFMQIKITYAVLFQLASGSSSSWRAETQKRMCFDSCLLAAEVLS